MSPRTDSHTASSTPSSPKTTSDKTPRWPWLAYAVLLVVGVPWYWPADASRTVLGWPLWALVSLLASAGMSVLTAYLAIAYWHVAEGDDHGV